MKKFIFFGVLVLSFTIGVGLIYLVQNRVVSLQSPVSNKGEIQSVIEKPLEKYSFKRLQEVEFAPGEIKLGETLKDEDEFVSRIFFFNDSIARKKVSGLINIPKKEGTYPLIVMFRGFVPREKFTTGEGTRRTAEALASQGFITLAPDFIGYGKSDSYVDDGLEDRFQTYTTAQSLLASLSNLNNTLDEEDSTASADINQVGIWGHSNGGHIALATLVISGESYPTVLWNPVTKPFPYSILYFTDEYDDEGKGLRKLVAQFEKNYDVFDYTFTKYLERINAPIEVHQADSDEAVPSRWSDQFVELMEGKEKDVTYFSYPEEDHNFNSGSWPLAVERIVKFYSDQFALMK